MHYLQHTSGQVEVALVQSLLACAEICQTSANLMLLGSALHGYTCAACAAICEQCAELCRQKAAKAQMKTCSEACHRCAESCYYMAAVAGVPLSSEQAGPVVPGQPSKHQYDKVDMASMQSFPASDPPAH